MAFTKEQMNKDDPGREGERERGREGGIERGREGEREGGREGGRGREGEGEREGERERERDCVCVHVCRGENGEARKDVLLKIYQGSSRRGSVV